MPDFAIDIWYDTPPPESKGAIWTEYVTAPDSARATESAMHRFTERHVPGLNVTGRSHQAAGGQGMKDRMKELTDHWDRMGEGCNGHPLTFAVADTTVTATCGCGQFEKVETIERDAFCPNAVDDACMNLMGAWEDDHIPIDEGG